MAGIKSLGRKLQSMGRRGDKLLAHITPEEARLLKRMGGAGTRNPKTGLLEFYDADGSGNAADSSSPTGGSNDSSTDNSTGGGGYNDGSNDGGYGPGPGDLASLASPQATVAAQARSEQLAAERAAQQARLARSYANPMAHIAGGGVGYQGALNSYQPNYYAYGPAPAMQFGANFQAPGRTGGMENFLTNTSQAYGGAQLDPAAMEARRSQLLAGRGPTALNQSFMSNQQAELTPAQPAETNEDFVRRQYREFLGREADNVGLADWSSQLGTGKLNRDNFADALRNASYEDDVFSAYRTVLGRDPEAEGRAYWLDRLNSGEIAPNRFLETFRVSAQPELQRRLAPATMSDGGLASMPSYPVYQRRLAR